MKIKQIASLIISIIILFSFTSAHAATSAEKENSYNAAVMQLEIYLESISNNTINLDGTLATFNELGGYSKSLQFGYYVLVLLKISNEEYDLELDNLLSMLEANEGFKNYLADMRSDSSIGTIDELVAYAHAREAEYRGKTDQAKEHYINCLDFYDASSRYYTLVSSTDKLAYEKALELMKSGDLAGAYYAFLAIARYNDSSDRMTAIVNQLGYRPASQTDNLQPVKNLKISEATQTTMKLVWQKSSHATAYDVYYKNHKASEWLLWDSVTDTSSIISGLVEGNSYDFKVVSTIGKITSDETVLSDQKTQVVTPTPKPTATPSPTPTPTPTPKPTPVPLHFDRIDEMDLHPSEDFSLHVTWSGGSGPYELCCYHYFNDDHNSGITKCMDKTISYDNRKVKNRNSGITAVSSNGARINHMGSGQTYWIVVKDSAGHSAWEKYTVPRLEFTDFTAKLSGFALKKWKGSWAEQGTTINTLKAADIKNYWVNDLTKEDGVTYGFQVKCSIKGFNPGWDESFGFILILPNGDEYVGGWGFPGLEKNWSHVWFNEAGCFYDIYLAYGDIPTGTYKLILTINGYIVGEKEFMVQ